MALAAPGQIVEADAGLAQLADLVELQAPIFGGGGAIDLFEGPAGDLPAIDAVEVGAGQALAINASAAPLVAGDVDQADVGQMPFEMVGRDVLSPG